MEPDKPPGQEPSVSLYQIYSELPPGSEGEATESWQGRVMETETGSGKQPGMPPGTRQAHRMAF